MQEETVTRAYLTDSIYKKLGFSRAECADLVDAVLEEVNKGLVKDGEVKISSFGSFKVRNKKQRIGRNPKTKQEVAISARSVVSFYASSLLKKRINN
jgi:integration host factor subunit alpha